MKSRRVLVLGSFDPDMTRNRQLLRLLEVLGAEVTVRQVPVWSAERLGDATAPRWRVAMRVVWGWLRIAVAFLRSRRPDVVLVPYPGQFDMFVLGPLARLRRVPLVLEYFISLHETVVLDRKLVTERSMVSRLVRVADRHAMRSATVVLADTPEDAEYFASSAGVPLARCRVVWIGADPAIFRPTEVEPVPGRVLFYGTYIPLHGAPVIVRAAALLRETGITVRMIGRGQERERIAALVRELDAPVEMVDSVPEHELPTEIGAAEICLGIFDSGPKASRVVPNKVFQVLAVGRPCITADTPAVRNALDDAVLRVAPDDPAALADAIRRLHVDEAGRVELVTRGRALMSGPFAEAELARRLGDHLDAAMELRRKRGHVTR